MASTGGRGGIPPHSPNLRELAELVRSRHRGVGGGGGWRRLAATAQPAATSCGQAQKASSPPASASSHPLAVAWPPRLGGSDRAWRARQPCTRRGRRLRTARVALAWSCRCTLWRRWCNAAGQWARRAAGAPLATRCASCSGAVDAAGGGEATAGGLAWPPFASGPGTSADLAGCSLDQQRVGSARCAVRRPTAHLLAGPGVGRVRCAQRSRQPGGGTRWDAVGRRGTVGRARRALFASARRGVKSQSFIFSQLPPSGRDGRDSTPR